MLHLILGAVLFLPSLLFLLPLSLQASSTPFISPAAPSLSFCSILSWPCLLFSAAVSFLISHLSPFHFPGSAWSHLYGSLSQWLIFLPLVSCILLPSLFPFHPSSIWLFISPIRPISLKFPSRPWKGFLRGISSLMWALCWMRLGHFIFRAIQSSGRYVLPQGGVCHPQKLREHAFIPPFPWMERRLSSSQSLNDHHLGAKSFYRRSDGPLRGTLWSFRASCCLVALVLCSCTTDVWVWSSVVEVCFCRSFSKYKNNH